jgi:hypothetical protein
MARKAFSSMNSIGFLQFGQKTYPKFVSLEMELSQAITGKARRFMKS